MSQVLSHAAPLALGQRARLTVATALIPAALIAQMFVESVVPRTIAILGLAIVLVELAVGRARIRPAGPLWWTCAYALLALASGWWTVSTSGTVLALFSLSVGLAVGVAVAALVATDGDLRIVLATFAAAAGVVGLLAVVAFAGGATERASGAQGDPNIFALYQLLAIPFVLVAVAEARRRRSRWLFGVAAVVIVASVVASLSRGGLIALAVVVLLVLAAPAALGLTLRRGRIVAVLVLAIVASATISDPLLSRFEGGKEEETAGSGRLNEWRAAWTSIQERPLLGLGHGGFIETSNELMRRTPGVDLRRFRVSNDGLRAHSVYIETAAELGVPGLALLLGLLTSTALALRRTLRRARAAGQALVARMSYATLIALAAWSVASAFLSTGASSSLWALVGLTLALGAAQARGDHARPRPSCSRKAAPQQT
jgi:putative inorganic carbon (HCO3(-)) transporter